jgi:hypothetical protein
VKKLKPVIIMSGLENKQILQIMKTIKNLEDIPEIVFASTTPTNVEWKLKDLINEVNKEHEMMKIKNKK